MHPNEPIQPFDQRHCSRYHVAGPSLEGPGLGKYVAVKDGPADENCSRICPSSLWKALPAGRNQAPHGMPRMQKVNPAAIPPRRSDHRRDQNVVAAEASGGNCMLGARNSATANFAGPTSVNVDVARSHR